MVEMTLWGIPWYWWVIAALFLAALGKQEKIPKVTFAPATILGILGGWILGWAVGDQLYQSALAESPSSIAWGGMYWVVGGALGGLFVGVAVLYLAMPRWERKARPAAQLVSNGPQVPVQPAVPPPPPAPPAQ